MFANRSDTDAAVEMFNLLGEFGLHPDTGSFNQLLNAYAITGDHVNAEAVIAKMRDVGLQPNVVTWTTLMKLYVQRKDMNATVEVFARMRRGDVEPNEFTFTQLINALAQHGGPHSVNNVRRIMHKMSELGMRLNVFH